ncbi:MAG: YhcH/YjgK/YiaL family protein [Verrucomicrobiota bacterium]
MHHGHLDEPESYAGLISHPVWNQVFQWLHRLPADAAVGHHELRGEQIYVSIQEYCTLARHEARFESHVRYVDLQYTLSGLEGIDWAPRGSLRPDGPFANDVQFWLPPSEPVTTLCQSPGRFAIFFPSDAHRPKVRLGPHDPVRKLVVKIEKALLAD